MQNNFPQQEAPDIQVDDNERVSVGTPMKCMPSPINQLPFSPSQFLTSPNLSFDVTLASTPVKNGDMQVSTPQKDRSNKPVSIALYKRKR